MAWHVVVAALLTVLSALTGMPQAGSGGNGNSAASAVAVSPAMGSMTTRFVVRFRAPQASGRYNGQLRSYSISARGPIRQGCQGSSSAGARASRTGEAVRVTLAPHGQWCAGLWHGAVNELGRSFCSHGACPQFVLVIRRVGTFTFRVRSP